MNLLNCEGPWQVQPAAEMLQEQISKVLQYRIADADVKFEFETSSRHGGVGI